MTDQEVRVSTDSGVAWEFQVSSSASTFAEQAAEMEAHCEQLFGLFGDFITPTELVYYLEVYPDDQPIAALSNDSGDEKSAKRELVDEDGITWTDFAESATTDGPGARLIRNIPFECSRLRVRLGDEDVYVEPEDCVSYHQGEPRQANHKLKPLSLAVSFWSTSEDSPVESEFMYSFGVTLRSDIWVKQTEAGHTNRAYLGAFLSELADALSPVTVKREIYSSDFWYDLSLYPAEIGNVPNDPADEY